MAEKPRRPTPAAGRAFIALSVVGAGFFAFNFGFDRLGGTKTAAYNVRRTVSGLLSSDLAAVRRQPHLTFRSMAPGRDYGTLSAVPLASLDGSGDGGADPNRDRRSTALPCNRVYAGGGRTVCLAAQPATRMKSEILVLDGILAMTYALEMAGIPSRARVSRDGRHGAYTVFVSRDSYMSIGFSTRTVILDLERGAALADLESFEAWRDGAPFRARDFNYWGVTFASDANTFYATLGTGGHTYLVRGDVRLKRVVVLTEGVECPSLSPDERRVAFKKKSGSISRPAILELDSLTETVLPELRHVDDQIEWLDDRRVLYAVRHPAARPPRADVWAADIDGLSPPALFLAEAESPSVFRPEASGPAVSRPADVSGRPEASRSSR